MNFNEIFQMNRPCKETHFRNQFTKLNNPQNWKEIELLDPQLNRNIFNLKLLDEKFKIFRFFKFLD